jgi:glutamyl endopeptidase
MIGSLFCVTVTTAIESTPVEDSSAPDAAYSATNQDYRISDSPYLRLPDDMLNWTPIVPPEPHEVEDMEDPFAVEIYNAATQEVTQISSSDKTQQPAGAGLISTPPYQGLLPPGEVLESVFPPDDRARVSPTTSYPWRTIGKLFLTFPDGATGWCSGALIGCQDHGYQVLTAGHCVYSHDHGGWASSVKFVPGLDENYMPYNYALNTNLISYVGWTQNGDHRYDMGWVILDRNVGDFTGWMGRITASASSPIYTTGVNTAGYPCNVYSSSCPYPKTPANTMWFDFDYGRTATENNHWYYMDTQGGQSGSPVWLYNYFGQGNRYIATVHAYSDDGTGSNHGTRLNSAKFNDINDICNAYGPRIDYADLIDDGQAYSGFTPTTVCPGDSFHVWCDVRNVGTKSSGGFYVSYYASTNTVISTSDYLIGTDYVSSISPFTYRDSDLTGTFPCIPAGTYYVGWIIDSGNDVTEFDETNNVAYKSTPKLVVKSGNMGVSPTSWSPTIDEGTSKSQTVTVSADVCSVKGVTVSKVSGPAWLSVSPTSLGDIASGSSKTFKMTASPPSGTSGDFTYTVRVKNTCGTPASVDVTGTIHVKYITCGNMGVSPTSWSPTIDEGTSKSQTVTVSASSGPVEGVTVSKVSGPAWLSVSPTSLGDIASGSSKTFTMTASPPLGTSGPFTYTVRVSNTCGAPSYKDVTGTIQVIPSSKTVVSIEDASAPQGSTVKVPIRITNVKNMCGANIWLSYDKNVVTVEKVDDGDLGTITSSIDNTAGITKMNWDTTAGQTGSFVFAYITLKAVGDPGDTSPLDLDVKELYDCNLVDIPHSVDDGTFTVVSKLMEGDVTDLNVCVSLKDSTLIKLYLVGSATLTPDQLECADTRPDDHIVNLKDSTAIKLWLVNPDYPLWESPADDHMMKPVPC